MKPSPLMEEEFSVFSPGRINLIGEHTDYNDGYVLPAAIDLGITLKFSHSGIGNGDQEHPDLQRSRGANRCELYSINTGERFSFDLDQLPATGTGWEKYILGVVHELQDLGCKLGGFRCEVHSNLPIGAGLSSSAALSCGLALGLDHLFSLGLDRIQIANLAQRTENRYVSLQCGIMDPFASLMGRKGHFLFLDCRSVEHKEVEARLNDHCLVLLNSGVAHELADSAYNERREECRQAVEHLSARHPGLKSLRDVSRAEWKSSGSELPEPIRSRCRHVLEENHRVREAVKALEEGNMDQLGTLLYASHWSLSRLYEVSCEELDFLVETSRSFEGVAGARMMGGGFGGCSLNLVRTDAVEAFIEGMQEAYRKTFDKGLEVIHVAPSDGGRIRE